MFHKKIKRVAIRVAVLLFFAMSLIGWVCDLPTATCATRAVLGAMAAYFVIRIAGQLIVRVLINAIIDEQIDHQNRLAQG